jgi:hypothetical protein
MPGCVPGGVYVVSDAAVGYDASDGQKIVVDKGFVVDLVHDSPPDPPLSPNRPQ